MSSSITHQPGIGVFLAGAEAVLRSREEAKDAGARLIGQPGSGRPTQPIEVFHCPRQYRLFTEGLKPQALAEGWYYWPCQPGCLPDGEAIGPFATSTAALEAATEEWEWVE